MFSITPQISLILKHEKFIPLSSPGGDGRNDIALLYIRTRGGRAISFDNYVTPACLPSPGLKLKRCDNIVNNTILPPAMASPSS